MLKNTLKTDYFTRFINIFPLTFTLNLLYTLKLQGYACTYQLATGTARLHILKI